MQIFLQKLRRRRPLHLWPSAVLQCCSVDTWLQYTDKLYYRHQLQPTAVQHCLVEAAGCFDAFLDPHSRATLHAGNTNCWMAPVNDWQPQNKAWMGVWGSTYKISNVNINNQMGGLEVCKELSPGVKECRDSVASGKYTRPHSGSWAPHHAITMDPMPEPRCSSA